MGETRFNHELNWNLLSFSILKRIVMGETYVRQPQIHAAYIFQYPQADRDG